MPDRPTAAACPDPRRPRLAPARGEAAAAAVAAAAVLGGALPAAPWDGGDRPAAAVAYRLDPAAARAAEWELLPRVGPVLAGRLAGHPFARPADLLAVRGVGPKTLDGLTPWLRFPADRPPGEAVANRSARRP